MPFAADVDRIIELGGAHGRQESKLVDLYQWVSARYRVGVKGVDGRAALRHSAPRGRGAAHGAVPRGRVTTGDGGGHDDAGMRRAQKRMSRSGRRSKRCRRRPTHTRPSTRASREKP
jgi:hypothetical protein